jgi:hypothetical protein
MMNLRGAKPIPNPIIKDDINTYTDNNIYNDTLLEVYKQNFVDWVVKSEYNKLIGIEQYKYVDYVHGTIQAFDSFYLKYSTNIFRFFRGEFFYHQCCLKNSLNWKFTDGTDLDTGDALIISVPFSDYGKVHPILNDEFLTMCDQKGIPILLDFAYYPMAKNIQINLNHSSIVMLAFSLSKAFYGMEFVRSGIRMMKTDLDDGVRAFNEQQMVNRYGLGISNHLITKYSVDYNWKTFGEKYSKVCKYMNLEETDCIMFGIGGDEYKELNRGTEKNRVCISDLLI